MRLADEPYEVCRLGHYLGIVHLPEHIETSGLPHRTGLSWPCIALIADSFPFSQIKWIRDVADTKQ